MGTLIAWVLVRDDFPGKVLLNAVIDLPFALPTIVAGLTLLTLYGPNSKIHSLAFTRAGIFVALLFVTLPFVVRTVQPVLLELDREMEEAAASLGVVLVAQGDASFRDFLGAVFSGWGCSVRIAANTREVLESFAEDQVGLAVLDRSVVEIDSRSWQAAWAPLRGRAALIAVTSSSVVDDATTRVLREEATVVVAVPHDLCMIRRAFNAATGIAP